MANRFVKWAKLNSIGKAKKLQTLISSKKMKSPIFKTKKNAQRILKARITDYLHRPTFNAERLGVENYVHHREQKFCNRVGTRTGDIAMSGRALNSKLNTGEAIASQQEEIVTNP